MRKKVGELEAKRETVPSHVIPPTQEELLHYGKHRPTKEETEDKKERARARPDLGDGTPSSLRPRSEGMEGDLYYREALRDGLHSFR
jgi:hypothetical protein